MIRGVLSGLLEPLVPLRIWGARGQSTAVQAIIDTGFTDYLTLPRDMIDALELTSLAATECQLADGTIIVMETFLASVDWHQGPQEAIVLASQGVPLLGMALLRGSHIEMDVDQAGSITIEPLE